ncbi:hypothetical protein B0H15DRAFT_290829 [Mycena belliarum]|uniref:NAD(P)-binding protein n=1 Tax=Mycena belliarum TaxID=1033014 RepID=A0AAD6XRX2_9AGAR|nr:hypothetical protein B0H15DRAFT_290829 [Mycena belliae]
MPPNAAKALESVSLAGQRKTAVIVGGTLGIGAAVARRLAELGCSRIFVFARNEARGKEVLAVLKALAPKGSTLEAQFVQGDLSDVNGMRAAAEALQKAAGDGSIDYLVMTQSGAPKGTLIENADGHDRGLAIQAISRFVLAYLLTTRGALAPGAVVLSVANPGRTLDGLSADDLSLRGRVPTSSKTGLFFAQSARDSSVLDAFHEELTLRYPQYRYYHLYPGLVRSREGSEYRAFPGWLRYAAWLSMKLVGATPDKYAVVPVYVLTAPPSDPAVKSRFLGEKLAPMQIGKWAADPKNRAALWEKLLNIIGEEVEASSEVSS